MPSAEKSPEYESETPILIGVVLTGVGVVVLVVDVPPQATTNNSIRLAEIDAKSVFLSRAK
jgi:hypothetical protein